MNQDLNSQGMSNVPQSGGTPPVQGFPNPQAPQQVPPQGLPVGTPAFGGTMPPQGTYGLQQGGVIPPMPQGAPPYMQQPGLPYSPQVTRFNAQNMQFGAPMDTQQASKYAGDMQSPAGHQQKMMELQREFDKFLTTDDESDVVAGNAQTGAESTSADGGSYLDSLRANFSIEDPPAEAFEEEEKELDITQIQQSIVEKMIEVNSSSRTTVDEVHQQALQEVLLQQQTMLQEQLKKRAEEEEEEAAPWLVSHEKEEEKVESKKKEAHAEAEKEDTSAPQYTGRVSDFIEDTTVVTGTLTYNDMAYGQIDEVNLDDDDTAEILSSDKKKAKKAQAPKVLRNRASKKDRKSHTIKGPRGETVVGTTMADAEEELLSEVNEDIEAQEVSSPVEEAPAEEATPATEEKQSGPKPRPQKVLRRKMAKTGNVLDKYYMNIAQQILREASPVRRVPYVIGFLLIVAIIAKFAFIDIYNEFVVLQSESDNRKKEIEALSDVLDNLEQVQTEVALYSDDALTDEEKSQIDILKRIEIFEKYIMSRSRVESISITGNTISTSLTGLTLQQTRELLEDLRKDENIDFAEVGEISPVEDGTKIDPLTGEVYTQTTISFTFKPVKPKLTPVPDTPSTPDASQS